MGGGGVPHPVPTAEKGGGTPIQSLMGRWGIPIQSQIGGFPDQILDRGKGYPIHSGQDGVPPEMGYPPRKDIGPVEVLWGGDGGSLGRSCDQWMEIL